MGKTNNQTVGYSKTQANQLKVTVRPEARPEIKQDNSKTTNNELPIWVWIVFIVTWIVGWVTDTPKTIIGDLFNARKKS